MQWLIETYANVNGNAIYEAKKEFVQFELAWKSIFGMTIFILQCSLNPLREAFLLFLQVVFRNISPAFLKDIPKLFFGCWLPFVSSSVCFNNVEIQALGRIHHSIGLVATDFSPSTRVIWHNSAFCPCFPSLRMETWQPPFHGDHFWSGFSDQ